LISRPEHPQAATAAHVLLIEDNVLVSDALRVLIEAAGNRVSVAGTVADALAIGEKDPASLVLIDLTLPDGDGLSVINALSLAGSRVFVALTGHDDPETAQRCRRAGCTDVLVKPVPARELIAKTAGWLATRTGGR